MKTLDIVEIEAVAGGNSFAVGAAGLGGFGGGFTIGASIGVIGGPPGILVGGMVGGFLGTVGATFAYFSLR